MFMVWYSSCLAGDAALPTSRWKCYQHQETKTHGAYTTRGLSSSVCSPPRCWDMQVPVPTLSASVHTVGYSPGKLDMISQSASVLPFSSKNMRDKPPSTGSYHEGFHSVPDLQAMETGLEADTSVRLNVKTHTYRPWLILLEIPVDCDTVAVGGESSTLSTEHEPACNVDNQKQKQSTCWERRILCQVTVWHMSLTVASRLHCHCWGINFWLTCKSWGGGGAEIFRSLASVLAVCQSATGCDLLLLPDIQTADRWYSNPHNTPSLWFILPPEGATTNTQLPIFICIWTQANDGKKVRVTWGEGQCSKPNQQWSLLRWGPLLQSNQSNISDSKWMLKLSVPTLPAEEPTWGSLQAHIVHHMLIKEHW